MMTLNGTTGVGVIYRPKEEEPLTMDEEESSGIQVNLNNSLI